MAPNTPTASLSEVIHPVISSFGIAYKEIHAFQNCTYKYQGELTILTLLHAVQLLDENIIVPFRSASVLFTHVEQGVLNVHRTYILKSSVHTRN
jgi:hypothetical protein